jgi:hypothetical protein
VSVTIGSTGAVSAGQVVEFDLRSIVAYDGTYSFALTSTKTDEVAYSAKEGLFAPQLVVTTQS